MIRDRIHWLTGIFLLTALLSPLAAETSTSTETAASQSPIQQMAVIMYRLKHFPSPQSKETLQQIVASSSATEKEKVLATAILNLNHRALMDDKIKLKKIMDDESASTDERDLASIVYNLDHRPTKGDKKHLKEMMQ